MNVRRNALPMKVLLITVILVVAFSGQVWANQEAENGFTAALFDRVVEIQDQQNDLAPGYPLDLEIIQDLAAKADRAGTVRLNKELLAPGVLKAGDNLLVDVFADKSYLVKIEHIDRNRDTATLRGKVADSHFSVFAMSTYQDQAMVVLRLPEENSIYILSYSPIHDRYLLFEGTLDRFDYPKDIPALIPPEATQNEARLESRDRSGKADNGEQNPDDSSLQDGMLKAGSPGPNDPATIDVMVVYTPAAKNWAGGLAGINNQINIAMIFAQDANDNSNTGITMRLVHSAEVSYVESGDILTDLERLTATNDGHIDIVHSWRNHYGADLVALFTSGDQGGMGWLFTGPSWYADQYGFSVSNVQYVSWTYTHIHEMGHNMGAHHHKQQNHQPGPNTLLNTYSAGWRFEWNLNWYNTLMSYSGGQFFDPPAPGAGITSIEIGYFSSPLIKDMGVPFGHAADGDNARTLRETKHYIAAFRDQVVGSGSVSVSIEPTEARTAGAQWRLTSGSDQGWKNSGDVIENLNADTAYTITFKGISGWIKPDDITVTIVADATIYREGTYSESTALYCQDFSTWLPEGWSKYQLGSQSMTWEHSPEGDGSAWHNYDDINYLDNWLVSPPISLPASGTIALSFLEKNIWVPDWYGYSGVFVSTGSGDPGSGSWEELYESNMAITDWTKKEINISPYAGNTVYIGFNYRGQDAHEWWIDNFSILADAVVPAPAIDVEKFVSPDGGAAFFDADTPPGPNIPEGTDPIFRFVVTNTGNVTLSSITLADSVLGPITIPTTTLAPGQSFTVDVTGTWAEGEQVNTATATATATGEFEDITVTDDDPAHYVGVLPAPIQFTLKIDIVGQGTTTPVAGTHTYDEGTPVDLTAEPAASWEFEQWVVDEVEHTTPEITVTMDADKNATAHFTELPPEQYTFTVAIEGQGTTDPAVGTHTYDDVTEVTLTATPAAGWAFDKWVVKGVEYITPEITVTVDTEMTATAYFLSDTEPAGVSKFIAIDVDDTHYVYDYEALLSSYVAHVMGLPGAELYEHFSGQEGTAALYDAGRGYIDYQDVLDAYVAAVIAGEPFSMDDYIASGQAMPYDITGLEIFEVTVEDGTIVLTPAG